MELLEGEDLRSMLARRGPLPPAEVVDYMLQSCEALAEAHALGIIHRDVKPANLFITRRTDGSPLVKVLDFGISKQLSTTGEANLGITGGQALLGSPQYMSPEQIISPAEVDARADVWSLGVTLYELSTGRLPFDASNLLELIAAILHHPAAPTTGSLPPTLEQVLRLCLEKERAQRYPHVAALAADLVPLGPADAAVTAARIGRILKLATPPAGPQIAGPDAGPSAPSSGPRRRRRVAALFGAAALTAAVGLWLAVPGPAPRSERTRPTGSPAASAPARGPEPPASPSAATSEVVPQPPRSAAPPNASATKKRVPRPRARAPRPATVDVFKDRL
jgi:serine/threonine-protein kinase